MIRAIVSNGTIQPQDPLPPEWCDGRELHIEAVTSGPETKDTDRLDQWYEELKRSAAEITEEDDRLFQDAIQEIRREAKEIARREMGLA